jgi:hypothetical protein
MKDRQDYLYAKDVEKIQITHGEYTSLMEEMENASKLNQVRESVLTDLLRILNGADSIPSEAQHNDPVISEMEAPIEQLVEPESDMPAESNVQETENPEPEIAEVPEPSEMETSSEQQPTGNIRAEMGDAPPIKQEIAEHFNKCDESGRLFNIFKQYYTCLNESCGGTVRVTMKDGFCSLWNYDEWEEFAWVDIYEDMLRIAIDPRYTDALKVLSLCEAPRLISTRRNVICVQVGDLNNTVLEVLAKAFSEVGMQVG